MDILKRNGSVQEFDKQKIFNSIICANNGVCDDKKLTEEQIQKITDEVYNFCNNLESPITYSRVGNIVENSIMKYAKYEVAKAYIKYRYEQELKSNIKNIEDKLFAKEVVNQNANIDEHSFSGRMGEATSVITKKYAIENMLSDKSKMNHNNNEIYIHDLDHYAVGTHNCLSIPFDHLLKHGFDTRQVDIRPPQSINTAFQLVAVIFQLQSLQQFGGVSATHIDWTMVPYVRKSFAKHYLDGLRYIKMKSEEEIESIKNNIKLDEVSIDSDFYKSDKSVYDYALRKTQEESNQAVEALYHNLNSLQSRSGGQVPFTSINYGTCILSEGRMIIRSLLETSIKGLGRYHRTSIFPCGIFQLGKGINRKEGDPNYDLFKLALKSTALRLYPNYANIDWSVERAGILNDIIIRQNIINSLNEDDKRKLFDVCCEHSEVLTKLGLQKDGNFLKAVEIKDPRVLFSTMGCRTTNGADINFDLSYKESIERFINGEYDYEPDQISSMQKDSRGNICPVTIILPTLAMESGRNVDNFMNLLEDKIIEAKNMLLERFEWICSQSAKSATFMYDNGLMMGYKGDLGVKSAIRHGTIVIGQLGLAETLYLLLGKDHTTEEGMELAKRIEEKFKTMCAKFKTDYKLNFGVYYTPAENLCFTSMVKFKEKYGVIEHVSDKKFFTNSIHIPVWHKISPFKKIDIESQLTGYSNAGCITYIELDSNFVNNIDALETVVNYAMDKDIPYFAINVPSDTCLNCGYQGEINGECPRCNGDDIQRLRRVTGYLTGDWTIAFNEGKQQEVELRVKHSKYIPNNC